jgi:hypothetical protein
MARPQEAYVELTMACAEAVFGRVERGGEDRRAGYTPRLVVPRPVSYGRRMG